MKKIILLILFVFVTSDLYAARKKAVVKSQLVSEEKIYDVPQLKSEIQLTNTAPPIKKYSGKRPEHHYYAGLVRGSLTYKIPTLNNGTTHFSPDLVGLSLSLKSADQIYYYKGNYELVGEWQRFKRTTGVFSQKINVFQFNLIQNFDLGSFKNKIFFSAGLGAAPIYLIAEQSVFGNSLSRVGAMGLVKLDFNLPIKSKLEADLGIKGGWGNIGGDQIFLSTLNLGLNFE